MGILRKIALKVLKTFTFDTNIRHHYTGKKIWLNSYLHKGYWYYGKKREFETVVFFHDIVKKDQTVIEVGGHIGYFTTLFSQLVGSKGRVFVFEPGSNNLKYIRQNIANASDNEFGKIQLIEKGAGNIDGVLEFYLDPLTGQNNSFVQDFEGFYANRSESGDATAELKSERVEVSRLDTFVDSNDLKPDFIKIDVEGFELQVLRGMGEVVDKFRPNIMIEIQKDAHEIIGYFLEKGYFIYNEEKVSIQSLADYDQWKDANIFFLNKKI